MDRLKFLHMAGAGIFSLFEKQELVSDSVESSSGIIKPRRLIPGATIGLVSPGFILENDEQYERVVRKIRDLGFNVSEGSHARDRYGYLAGKDEARAADLNAMFKDTEVDAVLPFRGGWGSNRLLEHIDFELIKRNPKPLIGFSDITSLLLAVYAKTGLVTFHGPVGKSEWTEFTREHFRSVLMHSRPGILENPSEEKIRTLVAGRARGPLIGGNLTVLTSMLGSDFLPDFKGALLFLEDVGEDIYRIDRMLTQLKLNGILDRINGFILGKCTDCNPGMSNSLSLDQLLNDHIRPLKIPAVGGSMIGHIDNMFTLPIGLPAELDSEAGTIRLMESAVV